MKTTLQILTLIILILIGCQNRTSDKTLVNTKLDTKGIELNKTLIEEFYRDERLKLENPDFEFYMVSSFGIDLNNNQKSDSIILKRLKGWENDPGDFHQIRIKMDNGFEWTETNFLGWVRFDHNYLIPKPIKKLNQINTDLLLLTDFQTTKILGLFGWAYASEPGLLTIIEFSTGLPRLMINKNLDLINIDNNKISTQYLEDKYSIECINNIIINDL